MRALEMALGGAGGCALYSDRHAFTALPCPVLHCPVHALPCPSMTSHRAHVAFTASSSRAASHHHHHTVYAGWDEGLLASAGELGRLACAALIAELIGPL